MIKSENIDHFQKIRHLMYIKSNAESNNKWEFSA